MRIVLVAGMLVMALFFAVLSAVNGECPSVSSSGMADTRAEDGNAG